MFSLSLTISPLSLNHATEIGSAPSIVVCSCTSSPTMVEISLSFFTNLGGADEKEAYTRFKMGVINSISFKSQILGIKVAIMCCFRYVK